MQAILVLLCALYAVSAQDQQPQLAPVVVLTGGQQQVDQGPQVQLQQQGDDPNQRSLNVYQPAPARPSVVVSTYQQPRPAPQPVQVVYSSQGQQNQQSQNAAGAQVNGAAEAARIAVAAAVQQGANPNRFGIQTNARFQIANQPNPQNPDVFTALAALRGRQDLTIDEILNILANAVAGRDYPIYNDIPNTRFSCENVKQAGFYADQEAQCQVIRRCDINGVLWSYLCPNMTLFNQITLVCDWFFNINCNNAVQYYDYSNPRLYTQFALLDTPAQNARPGFVLAQPAQQYQG